MADSAVDPAALDEFFRRWEASGAAERANYSMFWNELCDLLDRAQGTVGSRNREQPWNRPSFFEVRSQEL